MREPTYSPWGEIQWCEKLYPGMYLVETASHGGVMVDREAELCLTSAARKCGMRDGGYLCFEEDCCEQVILRELLDRKIWKIPERVKDPETFEKALDQTIQKYHPEYWATRQRLRSRGMQPRRQGQPVIQKVAR